MRRLMLWVLIITVSLALSWFFLPQQNLTKPESKSSINDIVSTERESFARVLKPRAFIFPQDHGPHPKYLIEWWYFTGNLQTDVGRKFGYELTFFRLALTPERQITASNWRNNQLYIAHFALTDVDNLQFYTDERFSRAGNDLAGAATEKYHVWLYDWKAEAIDETGLAINLEAKNDDFAIALRLDSKKKIALQGVDGFSRKSPKAGNASYYYSYTRMATTGSIQIKQQQFSVTGISWMDREWSSSSLSAQQTGWDWFALQLSDNSELMFYRFRRKDDSLDTNSSGAFFHADDSKTSLKFSDVAIKVLDYWISPHTNISYPSKWHLSIPRLGLELDISPLINDQELNVAYRYWEGAVSITGKKNDQFISGQGYVELTGYQ
ncbi:MAG: carotenoid 1,2-hydratase [Methylomarinum sp.]|nr:carotenoid 1,2-hydratase [Methylomarinum sp.]